MLCHSFIKSSLKLSDVKRTRQRPHKAYVETFKGKPKPFLDKTRAIQRHCQDKEKTKIRQANDSKRTCIGQPPRESAILPFSNML